MVYACVCALIAFGISLAIGGRVVDVLRAMKIGKAESGEEPEEWKKRAGKPTMGGFIFMAAIVAVGLYIAIDRDSNVLLPLLAMVVAGAAGLVDDAQTLV